MSFKEDISKIINEWYDGLGYTQGIMVNLKKVCSDYDMSVLINKIGEYIENEI